EQTLDLRVGDLELGLDEDALAPLERFERGLEGALEERVERLGARAEARAHLAAGKIEEGTEAADVELVEGALELGAELEEGERRRPREAALLGGRAEDARAAPLRPRRGPGREAREPDDDGSLEALVAEHAAHPPRPPGQRAEERLHAGRIEEEDPRALGIGLDARRELEQAVRER